VTTKNRNGNIRLGHDAGQGNIMELPLITASTLTIPQHLPSLYVFHTALPILMYFQSV
jgi:hypothetical protein